MRILLIENDEIISYMLKKALENYGHTVIITDNGKQGIELALNNIFDIIIMNTGLPDKEQGPEICLKLRDLNIDIPIIFLSGNHSISAKVSALNSGADDYITKPFSFKELLARINAHTRRRLTRFSDRIFFCDISVYLTLGTVYCKDKKINLTKKEFHILSYLIKNRGKLVTKKELLRNIGNKDSNSSNSLNVHISAIRKKISNSSCTIKTLKNRGFVLKRKEF